LKIQKHESAKEEPSWFSYLFIHYGKCEVEQEEETRFNYKQVCSKVWKNFNSLMYIYIYIYDVDASVFGMVLLSSYVSPWVGSKFLVFTSRSTK